MSAFHRVIGIDLGTTYSVVAAYNHDKADVKVIPNRQNEPTTPSVVYVGPAGQISVGKAAKEKLSREPNSVVFEVKRIMGERNALGAKAMARAGGRDLDPEFVSACILKELKACAEKMIGEPIHDAVITVPAYFKEPQKNATKEAAKIARLNPLAIINEPTAAAIAYGLDKGEPQTFVVYDLGGGTFDVSVVRIEDERTANVLGTGGNARLGGGDIDQQMVEWVLRKMKEQHGRDFSQDAKLVGKLRLKAEAVKINLCNENAAQEFVLEAPTAGIDEIAYTVTPADFDAMCRPILEKTFREVDVALDSAAKGHGLRPDDIDAFVMVGGSSKIPAVSRLLKERYKKAIKSDLNPDEIVAIGAARFAVSFTPSLAPEINDDAVLRVDATAQVSGELANTNIKDVVSHTLGVGLIDDIYDPLIPKDHVIPHRVTRGGYTTARDNQTSIFVPVYQGDNPKASQNDLIGKVVIEGLTPEPKGAHQFQITFALDANGIFEGSLLHVQKGTVTPIRLDRGDVGLSQKKRVDLAEILDAGQAPGTEPKPQAQPPAAGAAGDAVDSLIQQASDVAPNLPSDRQREMLDAIHKVISARASGVGVAAAVAHLTTLVMRSRN